MASALVFNATVAKPAEGSFKHYDVANIQLLSYGPVISVKKRWVASYRQSSQHPSSDGLWMVRASRPSTPMASDRATADDVLWYGLAEVLQELYPILQAIRRKDLHHTNPITELPTQAFSCQASAQNVWLQQTKKHVGSVFETAHP